MAEVLLANHADVNVADSPRINTIVFGRIVRTIKNGPNVLAAGANPTSTKTDGRRYFAIAGRAGNCQVLLAAGNQREDSFGCTPFSYAAERNSPRSVKLLLDAKADPNGGNWMRRLLRGHQTGNTDICELLLRAGANPNAKGALIRILISTVPGMARRPSVSYAVVFGGLHEAASHGAIAFEIQGRPE